MLSLVLLNLSNSDGALLGQLLLDFLIRVRVGQMGIKIFIQNLCCLFAEVPAFPSDGYTYIKHYLIKKNAGRHLKTKLKEEARK